MGVAKAKRQRVRAEMLSTLSFFMLKTESHIRPLDNPLLQYRQKRRLSICERRSII